jgi:uncharacterized membrane protein (UPF0127 family)
MRLEEFVYIVGKNKKTLKVKPCISLWSKFSGLMFRKNSPPLLFIFNKEKKLSIHSFFCKPFRAIWLDDNKKATKYVDIYNWKPNFSGYGKYLLEIPIKHRRC